MKTANPKPTRKQTEVLRFIVRYVEANGYQPTYEEIAEHFRITRNAIAQHISGLQERGFVEALGTRAIRLVDIAFKAVVVDSRRKKESESAPNSKTS